MPAVYEALLANEQEYTQAFSGTEPQLTIDAMEKHFKKRLEIVNRMIESKKIDARMGSLAKSHFESHLEELKALRTQQ